MPNQQKLAREFVLLDNFYVNGDSNADGFNWSTAAIASDYVQKLWPASAAGRRQQSDFEGGEPAAVPPAGYLWTNAAQAGVSLKNYLASPANADQAGAFLKDLAEFEKTGQMPRLVLVRLGGSASDNDRALGRIVQGVSKSRFWPKAAIFVLAASAGERVPRSGLRDLAIREAARGGQQHVQHDLDAAHHRADSRLAPHDAVRRGGAPHVVMLPVHA